MRARLVTSALLLASVLCAACGGGTPRATSADLLALHQPTPDPTLDAVVRGLPRALAGVSPTPTPTSPPAAVVPKPAVKSAPTATPTAKPRAVVPTPTSTRR